MLGGKNRRLETHSHRVNENGESVNNFTVIYPYMHYTDLWPRVVVLLLFFCRLYFYFEILQLALETDV